MPLAVSVLAVTRATRSGHPLTVVSVTGLTGLLVSRASWSHHWVWTIPLLAALLLEHPVRGAARWAVFVTAVFASAPFWHPTAVTTALGWFAPAAGAVANSYTVVTAGILAEPWPPGRVPRHEPTGACRARGGSRRCRTGS